MQTGVGEVVCDLAEAAGESYVEKEDEAPDAHHHMEHVLVRLSHQHRDVVLLQLLRDYDCHENEQDCHEQQDVGLTR